MTDHYGQCEAALMTKVRTLTDFFPKEWQVSDDESVINRGADYFFITLPSSFPAARADGKSKAVVWNVVCDLYVRFNSKREALTRFKAVRSALFNLLHSDPMLNKTPGVSNVLMSAGGELQQDLPGDNPNFIIQTLTVAISQTITFQF